MFTDANQLKLTVILREEDDREFAMRFAASVNNADRPVTLQVISFAEKIPFYVFLTSPEKRAELQSHLIDKIGEHIEGRLKGCGLQAARIDVLEGDDILDVLRLVEEFEPDLVIKQEEHLRSAESGPTSSLDLKLARKCPFPLLLLDGALVHGDNVGCAIDPEPEDMRRNALCSKIFKHGAVLSNLLDSDLTVVRAWSAVGERLLAAQDRMTEDELKTYVGDIENTLTQSFESVISSRADMVERKIHKEFHKGSALPVLKLTTQRQNLKVLVIGSIARTGLPGFVLGNTSEEIIRKSPCSVLVVKPDDFKSPLADAD